MTYLYNVDHCEKNVDGEETLNGVGNVGSSVKQMESLFPCLVGVYGLIGDGGTAETTSSNYIFNRCIYYIHGNDTAQRKLFCLLNYFICENDRNYTI